MQRTEAVHMGLIWNWTKPISRWTAAAFAESGYSQGRFCNTYHT
jgi:hypothetical protein